VISIIVWFAGALPASNSAKPKGAGMWGLDCVVARRWSTGCGQRNWWGAQLFLARVGVAEVVEIQNQIVTWIVYLDWLCLLMFAGLVGLGTLGLWVVSCSSFRYAHALYTVSLLSCGMLDQHWHFVHLSKVPWYLPWGRGICLKPGELETLAG